MCTTWVNPSFSPCQLLGKKNQVVIAQSHLQWFWAGRRCERTEKAAWVKECSGQACRAHKTFSSTCFLSEAVLEYKLTLFASYSLHTALVKYYMDMQINTCSLSHFNHFNRKAFFMGVIPMFSHAVCFQMWFLKLISHQFCWCADFFSAIFPECEDTAILLERVNNLTR